MTLRDDILPIAFNARGIAGSLGFRPYTVAIVTQYWPDSAHTGEGGSAPNGETTITEGGGQPPKVRWLSDKEIAFGGLSSGTIEIGPITPAFTGGGTELETIMGDIRRGETRYVKLTGPKYPDGCRCRIVKITAEKALRYMLQVVPVTTEP